MPFQKTWQNHITTPIPNDVDPSHIVSILHDHGYLITISPIVTRYEVARTDPDPDHVGAVKITYDVWETIGLLPGGLAKKEISFSCAFENRDDGVVSWIQAPLGLTSRAAYAVTRGSSGGGDGGTGSAGNGNDVGAGAGAGAGNGNAITAAAAAGSGGEGTPDVAGWVLEERIESSCSLFLKGFVEKTMVNTRRQMHARFVEKARERQVAGGGR